MKKQIDMTFEVTDKGIVISDVYKLLAVCQKRYEAYIVKVMDGINAQIQDLISQGYTEGKISVEA